MANMTFSLENKQEIQKYRANLSKTSIVSENKKRTLSDTYAKRLKGQITFRSLIFIFDKIEIPNIISIKIQPVFNMNTRKTN